MALPKIDSFELQYLNLWFTNVTDTFNYNLQLIEIAVPALSLKLTTLDSPPIEYLRDAFDKLTINLDKGFVTINDELEDLKSRIAAIESKGV